VERKIMKDSLEITRSNSGQSHMASSKDCHFFKTEKEIYRVKFEKNITYPEARRFVGHGPSLFFHVPVVDLLNVDFLKVYL
jgi:hypothetical protein